MMKKFTALLLTFLLLYCLTACAGSDSTATAPMNAPEREEEESYLTPIEPSETERNNTENPIPSEQLNTSYFWNVFESKRQYPNCDAIIADALDFSEGFAWIFLKEFGPDASNEIQYYEYLIDTDGNVIFETPQEKIDKENHWGEHYYYGSNIIHGVSLLSNDTLINSSGDVVWNLADDGWSEANRIFGTGNVTNIWLSSEPFNGFAVVNFQIDTYSETGKYCGLLNPDGTWLIEPTSGKRLDIKEMDSLWYSLINGNYNGFLYWDSEIVERHKNYFIIEYENEHGTNTYYLKPTTGEKTVPYSHKPSEGYYCFDEQSGELIRSGYDCAYDAADQAYLWVLEETFESHDGLLYNEGRFIDKNGTIIIDLSEYILSSDYGYHFDGTKYPYFNNGYCVLLIENKDKGRYFTTLDTQGNRLFEPIKEPPVDRYTDKYGIVSSNRIFFNGVTQFMDLAGQFVGEEYTNIAPYYYNRALVKANTSRGLSCLYIDPNGIDAFPKDETPTGSHKNTPSSGIQQDNNYTFIRNFIIEGKWKSIGEYGFGQAQPGAIVAFDGKNCNLYSPMDTYAFYADGDHYVLDATSVLSGTVTFEAYTIDKNHIDLVNGGYTTELERVD